MKFLEDTSFALFFESLGHSTNFQFQTQNKKKNSRVTRWTSPRKHTKCY